MTAVTTVTPTPCQRTEGDLWFAQSPSRVELAKALCGPCPVRKACLQGAVDRREPWGVWGGQLVEQGKVLPRKTPLGRPRRDDVRHLARVAQRNEASARSA